MGQIKNIKLHIVTDIKVNHKFKKMVVGGGVEASGSGAAGSSGSGNGSNNGDEEGNHKWNILDPETILDHCVSHDGKRLYLVKWKPKWVKKKELPEGVFEKWQDRKKGIGLDEPEDGLRIVEERRVTPEELAHEGDEEEEEEDEDEEEDDDEEEEEEEEREPSEQQPRASQH